MRWLMVTASTCILCCLSEPGEFQFDAPHAYADLSSGKVKLTVLREFGVDGKVTMEYSTM